MSSYETHIDKVEGSAFAIGDNARAESHVNRVDSAELADALRSLAGIAARYQDPSAVQVVDLAVAAGREVDAEQPDKGIFGRLAGAARKMMSDLGPRLIEVGALAEAVSRISELAQHW